MKNIVIYTDGACSGNPGPGGWGAVLYYSNSQKELSGSAPNTTNNRMELMAVIEALKALNESCQVEIHTDSKYVMDGITKWIAGWKKNNWRTAAKKAVKNQDLWQELDLARNSHSVNWNWVKGHSGNTGNELADSLATNAIKSS